MRKRKMEKNKRSSSNEVSERSKRKLERGVMLGSAAATLLTIAMIANGISNKEQKQSPEAASPTPTTKITEKMATLIPTIRETPSPELQTVNDLPTVTEEPELQTVEEPLVLDVVKPEFEEVEVGDYVDFIQGVESAEKVGKFKFDPERAEEYISEGFKLPKEFVDKCIAGNDAMPIMRECLVPLLTSDTEEGRMALAILATGLNLENGDPKTRDYGERWIFGKLKSIDPSEEDDGIEIIMNDDAAYERAKIEVSGLLLDEYGGDAETYLEFGMIKQPTRVYGLDGSRENEHGAQAAIKVNHITRHGGNSRSAYLKYDYNLSQDGSYYTFKIYGIIGNKNR